MLMPTAADFFAPPNYFQYATVAVIVVSSCLDALESPLGCVTP